MQDRLDFKDIWQGLFDLFLVTILWFFVSLLGILLSLGVATQAAYDVIAKVSRNEEKTYVIQAYFLSMKSHIVMKTILGIVVMLYVLGLFFLYQYALQLNIQWLMIFIWIIIYEGALGIIYSLGLSALFLTKDYKTMIRNVLIAMHTNPWRNIQLLSPVIIAVLAWFYVHPMTLIVTFGVAVWLHVVILKRAFKTQIETLKKGISS